jgi:O-antigen ligase
LGNGFLNKFETIIFILIVLTLNVTKVISFSETLKFNMALSDLFIPVFVILSLFIWKQYGFKKVFKGYLSWICLVFWLVLVSWISVTSKSIIDNGWMGLVAELFKTSLCIIYFFVGYNILRIITYKKLQISWSFATLLFILAGFAIYILVIKDLYFLSNYPKNLERFMGTDTDPNHAATFLTLSFFGIGIFALQSEKLRSKTFFYGTMSLSTIGLILTGSRGGLIGFFIGVFVLLCYYAYKNWRIALSLVLFMILMVSILLIVDHFHLESVFSQRLISKLVNIEMGIDIRANLSRVAWMMGMDHPVFGVGRGNFILNSQPYFEKLGVDVIKNIPHNTYFGLFAETGFIGLILYLMPFFMIVYALFKRYSNNFSLFKEESPILLWLFAGACALGVQAFVLNIENRRFLWFIAGVLIFLFDNKAQLIVFQAKQIKLKFMSIILTVLIIVVSTVSLLTAQKVYLPYESEIVKQNYIYVIPIDEFSVGKPIEIGIKLAIEQNEDRTDRILLKIVEESSEGNINVLDHYTYKGANGIVVRTFTPTTSDSKIYIKVQKQDHSLIKYEVLPMYLKQEEQIIDLSKWYFLQTKYMKQITLEDNKISYMDWVVKTDLSLGVKCAFDNQLRLEKVSVDQEDNENTVVKLSLRLLTDISVSLTPVLVGYPNNLHIMDEDRIARGYEVYKNIDILDTTNWKEGEVYILNFRIPRQNGIYNLKLGFYQLVDEMEIYLPVNVTETTEKTLLDLGSLNLDLITEGITYE